MSDPRSTGDSDPAPFRPDSGISLSLRARASARRRARRAGPTLAIPTVEARVVHELSLPAGPLRVREVGPPDAPTLLFVHGLLVDGRVWDSVVAELADGYRCILPDLPLGSHRTSMASDADLTPEGIAGMLDGIVAALDLDDVTVVASDSGGAITQLWMARGAPGVARVVLTPCDCFDNFLPPGFSVYQRLARIPGGIPATLASTRIRAVRALPLAYGGLTHRRIDDALVQSWLAPAWADAGVRRDLGAFLRGISGKRLDAATQQLGGFDRPVLLPWAPEQAWFPIEHARRLATILPDARVVEIRDSGGFINLDRPAALAAAVTEFVPVLEPTG
ncbi:MAG: alpha/beta hydrolase [Patulibacter sp.]|nr:alpha/beta hydrolase [Patulibacter sp.]